MMTFDDVAVRLLAGMLANPEATSEGDEDDTGKAARLVDTSLGLAALYIAKRDAVIAGNESNESS